MKDAFDTSDWKETPKKLLEKDVQKPSVEKARRQGFWARKFSATPGRTSVPDYIFGKNGRVFFVEFKKPKGEATELQGKEHKLMRQHGLTVYVCDTLELFNLILENEEDRASREWLK